MEDNEKLKEYMLKEIDIIQDIIKRMASNSVMLKGWTVTLVVVTLLLKGNEYQMFIAIIPLFVFWYLDAYFLWQEKMYRELYNWVINNRMNTDEYLFDMNAYRFKDKVDSTRQVMVSVTLRWFYGSIAVILIVIYSLFIIYSLCHF